MREKLERQVQDIQKQMNDMQASVDHLSKSAGSNQAHEEKKANHDEDEEQLLLTPMAVLIRESFEVLAIVIALITGKYPFLLCKLSNTYNFILD